MLFLQMLDYYGSIIKSKEEINNELISFFQSHSNESYLKKIIHDLRKEECLANEYSISGWLVFYKKNIHKMIQTQLNHQKQKNYQKLKFTYCFYLLFNEMDVCALICDKIYSIII